MNTAKQTGPSRRKFLKRSGGALTGAALASAISARAYAAESNTIKIALVGCGGRGTGAAVNALNTSGPTRLHAMADIFPDRLNSSLNSLKQHFGEKVDVPPERRFLGMDAFRKAMDTLDGSDVVLLATPPCFRPMHLEYAVDKGRNVFMEKSFAVDAPGIRRVLAAGERAKEKNLKIAGGLMWRHDASREALMKKIHDGEIGDVILMRAYRMHGPVGYATRAAGTSELAHQIRNYSCFTWINGSFMVDWLIHEIDVCCWAKNALPVTAQGQGGRQTRAVPDQLFDHYSVEYTFADGTKLLAQGRHIEKCYNIFSDFMHGSKGSGAIFDAVSSGDRTRIYRNHNMVKENEVWRYEGPTPDAYQVEHDRLFEAIRQNKPHNEAERCAKSAMAAIMGRMAAHSGQMITWDNALASNLELCPGLDNFTMESNPPVMPDAQGRYPVAMPGISREL